jgi:hypothetical protein
VILSGYLSDNKSLQQRPQKDSSMFKTSMRTGICTLLILLLARGIAGAQDVQVNMDPAIEQLVRTWVAQNRANPRIDGWRIQIMSSTDRQRVDATKTQFLNQYPTMLADWVHEKPYYKLRVGAFHTRQEAMSFLLQLKYTYPDAYPTRDPNIHPRDFLE